MRALLGLLVVPSLALVACVPQNRYDRMAEAGQEARREAHHATEQAASLKTSLDQANADVVSRDHRIEENEQRISALSTDLHNAQAKLEESQAINMAMRGELTRLVADVDRIQKEKLEAEKALEALRKSCGQDEVAPPTPKQDEHPKAKPEVQPNP